MKILIVDTSFDIVDRLANLVSEADIYTEILKATSYSEAINILDTYLPDAVLLDMNLSSSKIGGLISKIRLSGYPTSIIILSISINNEMRATCKLMGADFLLDKYEEFEKIPKIINATFLKTNN